MRTCNAADSASCGTASHLLLCVSDQVDLTSFHLSLANSRITQPRRLILPLTM
jgi:hypothetical protein